jgi:hypothetical protein
MQQYSILFSVDNFTAQYAEDLSDTSRKLARIKPRKPYCMFMCCHHTVKQNHCMRFEEITAAPLKKQAFRDIMIFRIIEFMDFFHRPI